MVYHPSKIANAFAKYFPYLYNLHTDNDTPQPSDASIQSFLESLHLPTLKADQLQSLNATITKQEITQAIKSLPPHKSPGADGFSTEYYKTFQHILIPYLCRMFNAVIQTSFFPSEMLQAVIVASQNLVNHQMHRKISNRYLF